VAANGLLKLGEAPAGKSRTAGALILTA